MELIYTSSTKGLDKGRQGYCTVACTESMPALLKTNLENMSGYSWVFSPHDKNFKNNPVNYSYMKVKVGQEWLTVFSRIGLSGLDYSGRPNKIAHYICLEDEDLAAYHQYSPSSIIDDEDTFIESWDDNSHYLQEDFRTLNLSPKNYSTKHWQEATGDGGWASYLVKLYRDAPEANLNIIYDSHLEPLKLIAETTALLTVEEQWDVTFSTYFNGSSLNTTCKWRFILRGSKYFNELKSTKGLIDLNDLQGQPPHVDLDSPGKWDEETHPIILLPTSSERDLFKENNESASVKQHGKKLNKRNTIALSAGIAIGVAAIFIANKYPPLNPSISSQEEQIYNYKTHHELIEKGNELEEHGDVLISITTEDFFEKLKLHKKITLDIFAIQPEEITTSLVATEDYQVSDNLIHRLYIKKVKDEFVQSKTPIFRLSLSQQLVLESLSKIDDEFIKEFKKNVLMMKVNRVIFKFI